MSYCDPHAAEQLFRHRVIALLRDAELLDEDRIALLLSWKHSGFSVHNSVVVEPEDPEAIERLVRYLMRPPVSLERLQYDEAAGEVELRSRVGSDDDAGGGEAERIDADEFVARVIAQIPDPRRHLIHHYGWYSNAARAKRKREGLVAKPLNSPEQCDRDRNSPERKAARKRWAELIRRVCDLVRRT